MTQDKKFTVQLTLSSGRKAWITAHDTNSYLAARDAVERADKAIEQDEKATVDDRNWFRARPKRHVRVRLRYANEQPAAGPGSHMMVVRVPDTPLGRARIPLSEGAAAALMKMSKRQRDRAGTQYLGYAFKQIRNSNERRGEGPAKAPAGVTKQ